MKKLITTSSIMLLILSSCSKGYIPITETPPAPSGPISYQTDIGPVIASRCLGCHNTNDPQGNLTLENYSQVRNSAENGTLIQRINDAANPMPRSGLMPAATRMLFDEWVSNGYLEN